MTLHWPWRKKEESLFHSIVIIQIEVTQTRVIQDLIN